MKIYKGELKIIGQGLTQFGKFGQSETKRAVLEIGEHSLRNVRTDNYIESYLNVGEETEILIASFLGRKSVVGIRVNGKSRKITILKFWAELPLIIILATVWYFYKLPFGFIGNITEILIFLLPIAFYLIFKLRATMVFISF